MTPEEQLELDLQVERDIRAAKQARASARSVAMGGPFPDEQERAYAEAMAADEARKKRERELVGIPPYLAPPPAEDDVARIRTERERVSTPGGAPEAPYLEAREGFVPFLRPTRIEEVPLPVPMVGTERVIREGFAPPLAEPMARFPTGTEEFVEAFARQPVLTREAAKQLAAGAPPEAVQRKVGELGGAVVETPFQAAMRGLTASMPAAVTELYGMIPRESEEPVIMSGGGLVKEALTMDAALIEGLSPTAAKYLRRAAELAPEPEKFVKGAATAFPKAVATGLERLVGAEPGASMVSTLGTLQPAIPAPKAVPDKPLSERIREGEGFASVIQSDPRTVEVYNREFGAFSPLAQESAGFLLELPIPLTPIGAAIKGVKAVGAGAKIEKALAKPLTKMAVDKADNMLANRVYTDLTGEAYTGKGKLTLDNLQDSIRPDRDNVLNRLYGPASQFLERPEAEFGERVGQLVNKAKDDLARVAPSTELVRVSPSYAVPAALAPKVTREAAADVATLRGQAKERGRALTRAEEAAARDTAVVRAAQSEARRLDELGQFQVLLDGLDTPRAWDTTLFRAARAAAAPEQAMKRAAVVAAEQEVARKGQDAIRVFRREVEARAKQGEDLDTIITAIGGRELAKMADEGEVAKKVLEEAYGGERARALFARIKDDPKYAGVDLLAPTRARELHRLFVDEGLVPATARISPPNFVANAVKIIMEEGVRKRVSKQALDEFMARYPDLGTPTLAVPGRLAATVEERKFFENGAEEMFRLADSIPTRAAGMDLGAVQVAERLAAAARNVRAKVRVPIVAEAQLLAGERFAAPVRAYLTTRYGLPAGADLAGVNTPYGYLTPDDLRDLIDGLGGFGPSRMDIARKGSMVQDILLAAGKGLGPTAKDIAMGRPLAYATVDAIEEGFRRGVFVRALQEGRTPEAAIELARRSQLDYGAAQDGAIIQALSPYFASLVNTMAGGREFIDRFAKNPEGYTVYLRALREQQRLADPEGEQGDLPLTRFYAPIPDGATTDLFGRPLDVLGPSAPLLQPLEWTLGAAKVVATAPELWDLIKDGALLDAALAGSSEALDELAERAANLSAGFGGEAGRAGTETVRRVGGKPSLDQTYTAILALAKAYDPDRSKGVQNAALRLLQPEVAKPPKDRAAARFPEDKAWASRPPTGGNAFVFTERELRVPSDPTSGTVEVYYLVKPSKKGRQLLQTLEAVPFSDVVFGPTRAAGTAADVGVGEGILWAVGAETVEEPTKRAVEQTRP